MQVLQQAIDLLMAFTRTGKAMGVGESSRLLHLPPAMVEEMLQVLMARQWVEEGAQAETYRPGPAFLLLAGLVQTYTDLRGVALPVMRALQEQTGETVTLNLILDGERVCIEKVETLHQLRRLSYVGERAPLYAGASSRALLAYLPEGQIAATIGQMTSLSADPPVDPEWLRGELAEVRARGYALSYGERVPGIVAIAAGVRDYTRDVVASLSLTGPEVRFAPERLSDLIQAVLGATGHLSAQLGYSVHA